MAKTKETICIKRCRPTNASTSTLFIYFPSIPTSCWPGKHAEGPQTISQLQRQTKKTYRWKW